ncbi:hypothetical protein AB0K05_14035 [Nonomuraea sp. NPDC049486]|uniref:hypothetical protein n=1 Tax=Nonomuraea sp. NPDC049486 TaxID=3155773 RepID=UPI00341EFBDB
MPPLPRPLLAAWPVAAVAAFLPSWWRWEVWRELHPPEDERRMTVFFSLVQPPADFAGTPVLTPLLTDLGSIGEVALRWALPAVLVLAGFLACLGRADPEVVGRRVAWGLVVMAVIEPVTVYDPALPLMEWGGYVVGLWGEPHQMCYPLAALLVLVGSMALPRRSGLVDAA